MKSVGLDGSYGEGGGQILRTAAALSAHLGVEVAIRNMRARRQRPGLQPQHLAAVRAAAAICGASLAGDRVGSQSIVLTPSHGVRAGEYVFDIGTAGASSLVAQAVLLPLALADGPSVVTVRGGTHQPLAPPADYLAEVYVPALRQAGIASRIEYGPAGYYPRGGGELRMQVDGGAVPRGIARVERGELRRVDAIVVTSRLPDHVAERGAAAIADDLGALPLAVDIRRPDAFSPGAAVVLCARCEGGDAAFSAIGRPGLPIEKVAQGACAQLASWLATGAACDERLADQLVLPAALGNGRSTWTTPVVTEHLRTVLHVVGCFLPITSSATERADVHLVEVEPRRA